MSIFRQNDRSSLSRGVHQAAAEALSEAFGLDDDLSGLLDDAPDHVLADAEVDLELDEDSIEPVLEDLFLDLDDDDDEDSFIENDDGDAPSSLPPGRIGMAAAARQQYGLFKAIGRGLTGAAKAAGQFDEAYTQARTDFPSSAPLYPFMSSPSPAIPLAPALPVPSYPPLAPQVSSVPSVEAGPSSLPPVYVSDPVTADQIAVHTPPQTLKTESHFGASADRGIVGCQIRPRAKKAARNAVFRGAQAMSSAPFHPPQPLVEDPSAHPVLFSDGRVVDSMHGELSTLPCPSCARVHSKSVFGATSDDCPVCDGFGAILVPDADVPSYAGCSHYGFVQFLIAPLAKLAAAGQQHQEQQRAAESAAAVQKKGLIHARLMKQLSDKDAPSLGSGASDLSPGTPVQPASSPSGELVDSSVFGFDSESDDEDVFGFDVDDEFGFDMDTEIEGDDFGGDDLEDDDFGVDEWVDDVFGADDDVEDALNDDLFDEDDLDEDELDDEDDDVSSMNPSPRYTLARAMLPSAGSR